MSLYIVLFFIGCGPKLRGAHNAVEAVEGGVEVGLSAQAVQFYKHLCQEYSQEDEFGIICTEGRTQKETRVKT